MEVITVLTRILGVRNHLKEVESRATWFSSRNLKTFCLWSKGLLQCWLVGSPERNMLSSFKDHFYRDQWRALSNGTKTTTWCLISVSVNKVDFDQTKKRLQILKLGCFTQQHRGFMQCNMVSRWPVFQGRNPKLMSPVWWFGLDQMWNMFTVSPAVLQLWCWIMAGLFGECYVTAD